MCLAVIGKVLETDGQFGVADVRGNRVNIVTAGVADVKVADCVLIHAGFAIAVVSEQEYLDNRRMMEEIEEYGQRSLGERPD